MPKIEGEVCGVSIDICNEALVFNYLITIFKIEIYKIRD
jgi:hypothetical protein